MLVFVSCMWSGAAPGVAHKKIIIKKERERERERKKKTDLLVTVVWRPGEGRAGYEVLKISQT